MRSTTLATHAVHPVRSAMVVLQRRRSGKPLNSCHLPNPEEGSRTWRLQYWAAFIGEAFVLVTFAALPWFTPS